MRTFTVFFLQILIILMAKAQNHQPSFPLSLQVEINKFRYSDKETYVGISFSADPKSATKIRNNDTLYGGVSISLLLLDYKRDSLLFRKNFEFPFTYIEDNSAPVNFIAKKNIIVCQGKYILKIIYCDSYNTNNRDSIIYPLSIDGYGGIAQFSDLELSPRIKECEDKNNPFYINSFEVVPNPCKIFSSKLNPFIFSYIELYNLEKGKQYIIVAELTNSVNYSVKQVKRKKIFAVNNTIDVAQMDISQISSGSYYFRITLSDTNANIFSRTEKKVFIYNPEKMDSLESYSTLNSSIYLEMTKDEIENEFKMMKYLTNDNDRNLFYKVTDIQAKKECLIGIWEDIQDGKRADVRLSRELYLTRCKIAVERFRSMGRKGWSTDRGRVYLLYGEADFTDRFPSTEGSKPYEIWNYYQIENGVQFVFVDRSGFGDYTLVHSTKRGELQDVNWERFLR